MISNATRLLELASKKKGNYNVIKSYNQLRDRSSLIEIILYFLKIDFLLVICHLTYLTFLVNLHDIFFKSIYIIKFLNQLILNW